MLARHSARISPFRLQVLEMSVFPDILAWNKCDDFTQERAKQNKNSPSTSIAMLSWDS